MTFGLSIRLRGWYGFGALHIWSLDLVFLAFVFSLFLGNRLISGFMSDQSLIKLDKANQRGKVMEVMETYPAVCGSSSLPKHFLRFLRADSWSSISNSSGFLIEDSAKQAKLTICYSPMVPRISESFTQQRGMEGLAFSVSRFAVLIWKRERLAFLHIPSCTETFFLLNTIGSVLCPEQQESNHDKGL